MSNYSFLEKLRNEEKKKIPDDSKLIKIAVLGGAPISTQFGKNVGVNFTGYGEDGVLQPQNPAKMVETQNGTSMLHEGELEIKLPDGRTTIIPANQVPQDLMMKIQSTQLRGEPMQGYACGGKYMRKYAEGGTFERPTESQISPQSSNPVPNINMPRPNINIPNKPLNFGIPNNKIPNPIIGQDKINSITPINKKINTNPIVGPDIKNPDFGINQQLIAPDIKIPDLGIQNPIQTSQITAPDIKLPDFGVTNQTTQTQTPVTTPPNQYQKYLSQLSQYAQGVNPLQKQIQAETQEQYKAEEQAQKEALNQQLAQTGVTGREAVSEQAMASRQMGANQAQVESELRKQRADQAFTAAQQLPGLEMAGEKWDFDKKMTGFQNLLAQGGADNLAQASKLFGETFGQSIDFSNALKAENVKSFNTAFNNMNQLIASGSSWEDAMKVMMADGSFKDLNMTEGDAQKFYNNMKLQQDPVYKAISMADSWVKNGLISQDQADDFKAFLSWSISNPQGVTISDGWSIKDSSGNEVKFFSNQADLDKWKTENPDWQKVYTIKDVKNHVSANTGIQTQGQGQQTQVSDFEAYNEFVTNLSNDAPTNLTEWFNEEIWKAAGKPKDYNSLKTWMNNSDNIGSYLKTKYPNPYIAINKMKPEDQDLILNAIKNGNKDLIKKFQYTDKNDVSEANVFGKKIKSWKADSNGNYYNEMGFPLAESASIAAGRILEFNGSNGKQNIYIKSKTYSQEGKEPRDTVWTYEVVDVDTGIPFTITLKGVKD